MFGDSFENVLYIPNPNRSIGGVTLITKIIRCSFLVFVYHLLLIFFPINFFLITIKAPLIMNLFPSLLYTLLVFSPVLTILLSLRSMPSKDQPLGWIFPILVSMVGYIPLIISYFFIASQIIIEDCILILVFPILIGLLSVLGFKLLTLIRH